MLWHDSTLLCDAVHHSPPLPPQEDDLKPYLMNTVLTVFFWCRISHKRLCILFWKHATWGKKWHLEIFRRRVLQVPTRIQKSSAVWNVKRRIVIVRSDKRLIHLLKVRTTCASQEKEINPTLKVLVLFCFVLCLLVCLFYKVVNGWTELSSKARKVYNNQDWSLHWRHAS